MQRRPPTIRGPQTPRRKLRLELTLIRHGTAQGRAATDADRALTATGHAEAALTGQALARVTPPPDAFVSSPYRRALETARDVAAAMGYPGSIDVDPALAPSAPADGVVELVEAFRAIGRAHVVLVAHEPILSDACALLLGATFDGFHRGEMVRLRLGAAIGARAALISRYHPEV